MKCSYNTEDLIRYTEGLMCDAEKEELSRHLDICESCRSQLEVLRLMEGHIKEDVTNDGTMYLKIMDTIDKDRYSGKKAKFRIGAFVFRMAPVIKPLVAVILICLLALVAVSQKQQISNAISALGEIFTKNDNINMEDKNKDDGNKNSKFFTAEPATELEKGKPPEGWVLSGNLNLRDMGRKVKLGLYVKPDSNPLSSKTETGEVLAYLEDGNEMYDIGLVSSSGTGDLDIGTRDMNNDGIGELGIKGGMGASSVQFKVIGYDSNKNKWMQYLNTDYTEIMDLDDDGDYELVTSSVGSTPSFVWIYRWNGDHYEKMDVAKATGNDYALVKRDMDKVMLEAGKANEKHIYLYRDGILEEYEGIKEALLKDKVTNMYFNSFVKKEVWGKQGPGENYENVVKIPYGRVVEVIGMYTVNGGNGGWYLARLSPVVSDGREAVEHYENKTEFWLHYSSIGMKYEHKVTFEECTIDDAVLFNCVITGKDENNGIIHLRQLPDENSQTVSIANQGNLINVIQKDGKWSLVRIIEGRAMEDYSDIDLIKNKTVEDYCDIGWIKNSDYIQYKPDLKVNQGFLVKPFNIYDKPDSNSNFVPVDQVQGYAIAPVTIDEQKSNVSWSYFHGSFNGFAGWIRTEDIKYSFTSEDAAKIANPDIDLKVLAQKIRDEIKDWDGLTLNALDINRQVKLNPQQRKELSDSLKEITGYDVFDGGFKTYREALYPFYTLQFSSGNDDYYLNENTANPPDKFYKASFCKYSFIVTGEDTIMIQIPEEKLDSFGLRREGAPVKFLIVNREFVDYFKTLIPVEDSRDKAGFNHLLDALKVKVDSLEGDSQQQVYKCARVIRSFAGTEIEMTKALGNAKVVTTFEFTFSIGNVEKVIVTDKYISYRGKYYSLNGDPTSIASILFVGYF